MALQARSEGFNLERKAETGEMWLLLRGSGGEVDISAEAENLESLQRKTGAQSVIRHDPLFSTAYDMLLLLELALVFPLKRKYENEN